MTNSLGGAHHAGQIGRDIKEKALKVERGYFYRFYITGQA
jgi:hypothetical protein